MTTEKPQRENTTVPPTPAPDPTPDATDDSIPVPPDQQPVYPIEDPPAPNAQAPIDEGPKGPKKIAR